MSHMPPIDDRRRRALLTRESLRLIVALYFYVYIDALGGVDEKTSQQSAAR